MAVRADTGANLTIRPMGADDLDVADTVMRRAFGTLFGMPDPAAFMGDAECVRTRWRTDPAGAFVAVVDGVVVGSGIASIWGGWASSGR